MSTSLELATHGMIPVCPIGLNTLGQISCGAETVIPEEPRGGAAKRKRRVVSLDRDVVIKGQTATVEVTRQDGGRTDVEYTTPDRVQFAPPVSAGNAPDPQASAEDQELRRLLQRAAIIDHQRQVLEQLAEENAQAEELALLLIMLED